MFKFLHIADIHLGSRQYKLVEREQDFIQALRTVLDPQYLQQHAIDFILIAGDLFDTVNISADIFSHTINIFTKVKEINIPIIAIEGNHDLKEYYKYSQSRGSWYIALAQNNLLYFLHPFNTKQDQNQDIHNNHIQLDYKDAQLNPVNFGGYIQLNIRNNLVNIFGSRWHGAKASSMMPAYAESIKQCLISQESSNHGKTPYNILLLHAGHEDYLPVGRGGIAQKDFQLVSNIVDYIGLGHIHEHHVIDDFIFNPGSLEACNITEAFQQRGALIGTVNNNQLTYELVQDYYYRQFIKLGQYKLKDFINTDELYIRVSEDIKTIEIKDHIIVIEFIHTSDLDSLSNDQLKLFEKLVKDHGALHLIIRQNTDTYASLLQNNDTVKVFDLEKSQTHKQLIKSIYTNILKEEPKYSIQNRINIDSSEFMINLKDQLLNEIIDNPDLLDKI